MIAALLCRLVGHRRGAARELRLIAARTIIKLEVCPRCGVEHEVDLPAGALVRIIDEGFIVPRAFGVAWIRWQTDEAVCMPIPLNIAAAGARRTWFWCRHPVMLVKDPRQTFLQGSQAGLRAGQQYDDGTGGAA